MARHGQRRNSGGGVGVPSVPSCRIRRHVPQAIVPVHGLIQIEPFVAPLRVGKVLVREDEGGDLKLLAEIERLVREVEGLFRRARCKNDPRKFAMARVKHEEEVSLLGPRGQPCGRGRTLAHHDDYGRLRHGGKGDALDHEGEASSRGSGHRPGAGKGGAYGHVDCCDLILRLFYDNAPFRRLLGHEGEHARRGRHGVAGVEPAAGQDGAEAHGRIPVDQHVWGAPGPISKAHSLQLLLAKSWPRAAARRFSSTVFAPFLPRSSPIT